ncbi:phosphoserine phosphatase SerB [Massilia sp. W12]|uniref:phosphoserine phosphatase SerB n=1 Tax=Massilia sp. W12 TaxID=3126507 RepID=UPI0030D2B010
MKLILQGPSCTQALAQACAALFPGSTLQNFAQFPYQTWRITDCAAPGDAQRQQLQALCEGVCDYALLPQSMNWDSFGLLVMDMDSTLITIECIDEIADLQGLKAQVSEITEAAMRGELDFDASLKRRVALLQGLPQAALQQVYEERLRFSPGAENMLAAMRAHGVKTLLVSGGFTFFTERVKAQMQLDYAHANQLGVADGKLSGQVEGEILNAAKKRDFLQHYCAQLGITAQHAIAMGDGANDLLMMGAAGLSVAYHAKPRVKQQAMCGFDHVGMDGMLALLAY